MCFICLVIDILGSIDDSIENNEKIAANLEDYAISKYQEITRGTSDFISLGEIVDIYDSKRKPLSSRERESRKGDYRYYGATGVLDYVNYYLFDGEYWYPAKRTWDGWDKIDEDEIKIGEF